MLTPLECARLQREDYRKLNNYPDWMKLDTDKYDTQFLLFMKDESELVICFKCSDSDMDWKNNFHFWKRAYKDSEVPFRAHSGFLRCWKEVRHHIEDEVKKLNPTFITITGWSYGGAIAVLCKEDLQYLYPLKKIQCVTFGAPRVIGFWNFKKISNRFDRTKQFKNCADIVTAVPLLSMLFRHVRILIHIGEPIRFWKYFNPYKYHSINDYIKSLKLISKDYFVDE